jgi:predicted nucleic acid-binding protein
MGVIDRLHGRKTIGIDSAIFIYHLEAHPAYAPLTRELLAAVEDGRLTAFTSSLALMQILDRPYRMERPETARKYEALLANFPNLTILDIDREAARRAAQLRARFHLRPADALQAAAGLTHGMQAFITNNCAFTRLGSLCDVVLLEDCLENQAA